MVMLAVIALFEKCISNRVKKLSLQAKAIPPPNTHTNLVLAKLGSYVQNNCLEFLALCFCQHELIWSLVDKQ